MLLAVDVGNTETLIGLFKGDELAWHWRIATVPERTSDEQALMLTGLLAQQDLSFTKQVTGVVISSVVPFSTQALRDMVERYWHFEPIVVEPGIKTGVSILIDNPREVGADRVVNSLAAFTQYGGPCIVVDFGTATNFDVVSAKGEYLGGAIAPGLQVAAEALYSAAARLTWVELQAPHSVVGKNTVEAVQSGLIFGAAAEVDGMVDRIKKDLGPAVVVATGGLAPLVVPHCHTIDHDEPWLTLEGLRLVFDKNTSDD